MFSLTPDSLIDQNPEKVLKNEKNARENVKKQQLCRINRVLMYEGGHKNYVMMMFLKALARSYDPHSDYMSPVEKKGYQRALSVQSKSFGIQFKEVKAGEIRISHIVPGGPAWETHKLHKGDKVIGLRKKGGESIDLSCIDLSSLYRKIASIKDAKLEVSVKKDDGREVTVALKKKEIKVENNIIQSFILEGENDFGYISIPSFYTQWERKKEAIEGSAQDVARAVQTKTRRYERLDPGFEK